MNRLFIYLPNSLSKDLCNIGLSCLHVIQLHFHSVLDIFILDAVVGSNALQVTQMSKKVNFSGNEYFSRSFFKSVILLLLK